jgi:hypothetical protein
MGVTSPILPNMQRPLPEMLPGCVSARRPTRADASEATETAANSAGILFGSPDDSCCRFMGIA